MNIFIVIAVVLVLLALTWFALDNAPAIGEPWKGLLKFLAVLVGIVFICSRMGWL